MWQRVHNGSMTKAAGGVRDGKWAFAPLDEVQQTLARTSYPPDRLHYIAGKVEHTLRDNASLPSTIALLRLDTDFFESTRAELDLLWPRLAPGGWLYVDDYSAYQGSRRAVDEWLAARPGWTEAAKEAKAFKRTKYHPRGPTDDLIGSFQVWKAPEGSPLPFDVRNESVAALWEHGP